MTNQLWLSVLSSALLSAVVSALVAGWFSLRAGQNQYRNEYFKLVLERRIEAYDAVERLIVVLKTAVLGDDMRPHHMLFSKDDDHEEVYKLIFVVTSSSLWLSEDLSDKIREFNRLVFSDGGSDSGLVEFGKIRYKEIAELRTALERYHARDMLTLHDVPKFLERKKLSDSYIPIGRRS